MTPQAYARRLRQLRRTRAEHLALLALKRVRQLRLRDGTEQFWLDVIAALQVTPLES
jgi:hypothetical protein